MNTPIAQAFADLPNATQDTPFPWLAVILSAWAGSLIGYLLGAWTRSAGRNNEVHAAYLEGFQDGIAQPTAGPIERKPITPKRDR